MTWCGLYRRHKREPWEVLVRDAPTYGEALDQLLDQSRQLPAGEVIVVREGSELLRAQPSQRPARDGRDSTL